MKDTSLCIVVIGRNEGERLRHSLSAALREGHPVIYVDSGSRDGSVGLARSMGAEVLALDTARPFSAARARNEGAEQLLRQHPGATAVQFVDGDSILIEGWLRSGQEFLSANPRVAMVYGSLQEMHPEASRYNRFCGHEWNPASAGEVTHCGGNVLVRSSVFIQQGGYRADIIDSEDQELGLRIRRAGYTTWYLQQPMAWHDAGISRFGQWWRRMTRNGHGLAQVAQLAWRAEPYRLRSLVKTVGFGLVFPVVVVAMSLAWSAKLLLLALIYPLQVLRMRLRGDTSGSRDLAYCAYTVLANLPMSLGALVFWRNQITRRRATIIEYK
jgi:cellulose synthase/poly-beta-1,6-N-acetylglucosamine synthase-like glycosyltransferase